MREYFSIRRNGAVSPEEIYAQFETQSDFLESDCCGGAIGLDDIHRMLLENWITLDEEKITVRVSG